MANAPEKQRHYPGQQIEIREFSEALVMSTKRQGIRDILDTWLWIAKKTSRVILDLNLIRQIPENAFE